MRCLPPIFILLAVLSWDGCGGVRGTIVDASGQETRARKLRLESGRFLKIRHDGTVRQVALRDLEEIEINIANSRVHERELYFPAKVSFERDRESAKLGKDGATDTDAYLCINDALLGEVRDGRVRITLDRIRKLTIR